MVAVPAENAQAVADQLIEAGVRGILNYAPIHLRAPEHVTVREVDPVGAMQSMTYALTAHADRPLAAVQSELRTALHRLYRNVETDAVLAEPRRFYVHVSGAVIEPGRHVVMPIARVEDALTSAMGGVSPQRVIGLPPTRQAMMLRAMQAINPAAFEPDRVQPVEGLVAETRYRPAFRNVLVTHRDGTTERVDLLRYYATGDIDANPYLRDGDTVFLPFYDSATESVGVDRARPEPRM